MTPKSRRIRRLLFSTAALVCAALITGGIPKRSYGGAFPGSNGLIAFERRSLDIDLGEIGDIYTVDPANPASSTNLTNNFPVDELHPNWSPDGTRIVFASNRSPGGGVYHLWVMNADGTGLVQLTNNSSFVETQPSWSPDGSQIAFERRSNASGSLRDVWVMDAVPGSAPTSESNTNDQCEDTEPAWSTSGLIAVTTFRGANELSCSTTSNIIAVDPVANTATPLVFNTDHDERSPSWSPDSNSLAYEADLQGVDDNSDIFVKEDADGPLDGVQITDFGNVGGAAVDPAWSPDGAKITFAAKEDGSSDLFDIYTMNRNGSGQTKITDVGGSNDFNDIHPDWQPIPTVPEQPPAGFTPTVSVNPSVVRLGFVVQASGAGFPPGATVLLSVSGGISNPKSVTVDSAGNFRIPILIYPRDALGGRILTATRVTGPLFGPASDNLLVVPGSQQPRDFVVRN